MRTLLAIGITVAGLAAQHAPYRGMPIDYEAPAAVQPADLLRGDPEWSPKTGWLSGVLRGFGIDPTSQTLVFSKTSLQARRITPATPRAIYFGDDVYVGWVPGGEVLEVTVQDPVKGPVFYVVPQDRTELRFERENGKCLQCHASSRTDEWPAHVVRSVHPDERGHPSLRTGSHMTVDSSPLEERWGGWYVTGTHGSARHMGNVTMPSRDADGVDLDAGANVTDLSEHFDVSRYLTPHSDIVALLVLEHQTTVHNALAQGRYETQLLLHRQRATNERDDTPGHISEANDRRLTRFANAIVSALLSCDAPRFEDPIRGTSGFAERFVMQGPRDPQGRTLRELDLDRQLFRYPVSYMVYSRCVDELPAELRRRVTSTLLAVLEGTLRPNPFRRLRRSTRREVLAILEATRPELWRYAGRK